MNEPLSDGELAEMTREQHNMQRENYKMHIEVNERDKIRLYLIVVEVSAIVAIAIKLWLF